MNKHEKKKLDIPTKLQTLNPKQIMSNHEEKNFIVPTNLEPTMNKQEGKKFNVTTKL